MRFDWNGKTPTKTSINRQTKDESSKQKHKNPIPRSPPPPFFKQKRLKQVNKRDKNQKNLHVKLFQHYSKLHASVKC